MSLVHIWFAFTLLAVIGTILLYELEISTSKPLTLDTPQIINKFSSEFKLREAKFSVCARFDCIRDDYESCDTTPRINPESSRPPCCTHILKELLFQILDFLDLQKWRYVVMFGTLLGAQRNSKMIPWTADADIGIPAKLIRRMTGSERIRASLESLGVAYFVESGVLRICFSRSAPNGTLGRTLQQRWPKKNPSNTILTYVDNFPYMDVYGMVVSENNLVWFPGAATCVIPFDWIFPLQKNASLYGRYLSSPKETDKVLTKLYSETYKQPPKKGEMHGGKYACSEIEIIKQENWTPMEG